MKCSFSKKALPLIFISCLLFCACGTSRQNIKQPAASSEPSTQKGSWDNTPKVLTPAADNIESYSCDVASIDASNSSNGYIFADYHGTNQKVKLQITGPDNVTYTFDLHGGAEVFPLSAQSGTYNVSVYIRK